MSSKLEPVIWLRDDTGQNPFRGCWAVAMFDHDSKIACHVHENNHEMDFGSVIVVGHEANYHERLFLKPGTQ